ncbi:MDR family MFS transporter [Nocardioides sp. LS1]|uniref:MDR family MFS transporter n=1 Tax=Nocardioides sp. LS1 TaxID=1027620 RepID=UPI000F627222|nr:MDR family MFS transporter [Nocardioides sp. LS1]GCD89923.1 MFS transporter [Nocardioides sp. LS1]
MSSPVSSGTDQAPDYGVLRWLVAAAFVVILNETVMFNALPSLMREFSVDVTTAQWLSTAFMLTMAVVIPITGWFLQRVTTRQAFGLAMTVFCIGTLICASAPVFWVLLLGRIVQASGTAVMMPLLMTTLMTIVAPGDRGKVMGNVTLAMSAAPALGPTASGFILEVASWRWMFGIVLPIAATIGIVGITRLRNVGEPRALSLHVPSVLLSAIGFGTLVYGLAQFGRGGDARTEGAIFAVVGLVFVAGFVALQIRLQREDRPLLDLRTLRRPTYRLALLTMAGAFAGMFGSMLILPVYLQNVRDLSTLQTGLLMMPGGLAMGLLGPRVGRWFDKHGSRPLVVPGGLGAIAALGILTQVSLTTPIPMILGAHVLLMVSLALIFTPVFTLGLGDVPPHLYSHGSSLLGALQQVAGAMGTAIVATLIAWRTTHLLGQGDDPLTAQVGGMTAGFWFGVALTTLVFGLLLKLPNRAHVPEPEAVTEAQLPAPAEAVPLTPHEG